MLPFLSFFALNRVFRCILDFSGKITDKKQLIKTVRVYYYFENRAGGILIMKNITILLMCSLMYRAWTVETTWNGAGGDNLWMTAGNWESGVVPGVNDIVRFAAGGSPQSPVLLSDAVVTNGLVQFGVQAGNEVYAAVSNAVLRSSNSAGGNTFRYIGQNGFGRLSVFDGGIFSSYWDISIGAADGAHGEVVVDGGILDTDRGIIAGGAGAYGEIYLKNGSVRTSNNITLGNEVNGTGTLYVAGGEIKPDNGTIYVGGSGCGKFVSTGGNCHFGTAAMYIGDKTNSCGTMVIDGGTVRSERRVTVGNFGEARIELKSGEFRFGSVNGDYMEVGAQVSGSGTIIFSGGKLVGHNNMGAHLRIGAEGCGKFYIGPGADAERIRDITVGVNGSGELILDGALLVCTQAVTTITVRGSETASGILRGHGKVVSKGVINNNGIVAADGNGCGEALDLEDITGGLSVADSNNPYRGTLANSGTNGWYAVNTGVLLMPQRYLRNKFGEPKYTRGEPLLINLGSGEDYPLSPVNSVRVTYTNGLEEAFIGMRIYAADRFEAPPGGEIVGAWEVVYRDSGKEPVSGNYVQEFRFDHGASGKKDTKLYRLDSGRWSAVNTDSSRLDEYVLATRSAEPVGCVYAAVCFERASLMIVR